MWLTKAKDEVGISSIPSLRCSRWSHVHLFSRFAPEARPVSHFVQARWECLFAANSTSSPAAGLTMHQHAAAMISGSHDASQFIGNDAIPALGNLYIAT